MSRPPEGGRRLDLHAHTAYSDGSLTPQQLIAHARVRQLAAIGITDHDSVDAIAEARAAAGSSIEVVPGIEISTALDGLDLHILGYFVDPDDDELRARLTRFQKERIDRALAIVDRLRVLGVPVDAAEVMASAGPGVVGRPHIADALVRAGHVENLDTAFRRYLGPRGEAFVARPSFRPEDAITLIDRAGGLSVLAHPGSSLAVSTVEHLASEGLRGIEVWHPQHGLSTIRHYRALAAKLGLLETGGSDFHGVGRSLDLGEIAVPWSVLAILKDAAGVAG
ncbi:MAG TPA: PHP domain-containing protein [Candidatus Udaeobacter sp.]|jgi:predicted metal-dependent phosphoesterase TrpH|nr:PHP domain-containing protein [Candidatus Udaeobacter sp.]